MKKTLYILSIFIGFLALFTGVLLSEESMQVKADVTASGDCTPDTFTAEGSQREKCTIIKLVQDDGAIQKIELGSVTLSKGGEITVKYKYGFSELLIYARKCKNYIKDGEKIVGCNDGYTYQGITKIIHLSGDYYKKDLEKKGQEGYNSKTIHLFKYFGENDGDKIGEGSYIQLSMIIEFAGEKNNVNDKGIPSNTGFFKPIYCDPDSNVANCHSNAKTANENATPKRIKEFANSNGIGTSTYTTEYVDKKYLVYAGNEKIVNGTPVRAAYGSPNNTYVDTNVVVIVANTEVKEQLGDVEAIVFDTIIPALMIVLGISAAVAISVLGYQIVKSADEAGERQEKIKRLRSILIGIGIAFIILIAAGPFTNLVKGLLE